MDAALKTALKTAVEEAERRVRAEVADVAAARVRAAEMRVREVEARAPEAEARAAAEARPLAPHFDSSSRSRITCIAKSRLVVTSSEGPRGTPLIGPMSTSSSSS